MSDENTTDAYSSQRPSAPTVSQETPNPQTEAPEPLGDATCSASSDFISQTSENGNSNPDKNPSGASQLSQYSLAQGSRTSLLRFVECPELWRSLGGSDISRRLKHAILRWLELGAPDPKFGHLAGYWYEWVPLFESWLDSISAERPSAHTGVSPLGAATCSLSDLMDRKVRDSDVYLVITDEKRDEIVVIEVRDGKFGISGHPEFMDWLCDQIPEFRWPMTEEGLPTGNRRTIYQRVGNLEDHLVSAAPYEWLSQSNAFNEAGDIQRRALRNIGLRNKVDLDNSVFGETDTRTDHQARCGDTAISETQNGASGNI